jgi:hypothetical protein
MRSCTSTVLTLSRSVLAVQAQKWRHDTECWQTFIVINR